jgi:hypothetical protein
MMSWSSIETSRVFARESVQLDGAFLKPIGGPRKQRQAHIDDRGIEGIGGLIESYTEIVLSIKTSGLFDEHAGEIGVDAPVPRLVGVGQRASRDMAADAGVIQTRTQRTQTGDAVAQTVAVGQLRESHAQELIPARKSSRAPIAAVATNTFAKLMDREVIDELIEDSSACVHECWSFG